MKKVLQLLLLVCLILTGCGTDSITPVENEKENEDIQQEGNTTATLLSSKQRVFTIASEQLAGLGFSCGLEFSKMVYAVKEDPNPNWFALWNTIEGFEYVAGYEYVIEVNHKTFYDNRRGEPVWDEFFFVKVKSKEKKQSENLPADFL